MTEWEWLNGSDLAAMMTCWSGGDIVRRFRLFMLACCQKWSPHPNGKFQEDLVALDRLIEDGQLDPGYPIWSSGGQSRNDFTFAIAHALAADFPFLKNYALTIQSILVEDEDGRRWQADVFRDIFANPFQKPVLNSEWRSTDVIALARGIFDDRAFERLPHLADALTDAGCDSEEVIAHCLSPGPHVRGCWVVDWALGKA